MHKFPSFQPTSSYSSLLEWWFNANSLISNRTRQASFQISSILDHIPSASTLTSGFEFHHYDSQIFPDYLVFLPSTDLNFLPSTSLPDWWPNYINTLTSTSPSSNFSLVAENWLEFDFVSPNLLLNGLWQRVFEQTRSFDPNVWIELAKSISGSFISFESLINHPIISNLILMFSLPQQIGLMHGRSHHLKLMFQLDSNECLDNFHLFVSSSTPDIQHIFFPISEFLLTYGEILSPAISVDIDLLSKTLEPNNISIEIHQDHQIGRKLLDESFFLLDSILNISQSQFSSLSTLLNQLPYGQTFTFPASDSNFTSLSNISRLNHLKVQFRRNFWHLKSYVKLIQSLA